MRHRLLLISSLWFVGLLWMNYCSAQAAEWNPQAFAKEDTVQIRTIGPAEGEHWFPVWLVVLDGQVYIRLGTRAVERVTKNTTAPYFAVKIAGQQFERVKGEEAPNMANAVADAMAGKYWTDLFVRYMAHPLTLRLAPEEQK